MQNIAPTGRLRRRSRDFLLLATLVFCIGAALVAIGIALHIFGLVLAFQRGYAMYDMTRKALLVLGLGLNIVAMLMALRALTWKTDNALAWQLGAALAEQLGPEFVFIRNLRGRLLGYIDAALVTPHWLLALRISRRRGRFLNRGGQWSRWRRGRWRRLRWNPTREVLQDALKLKDYLSDYDLGEVPVYAAVVFMRAAPLAQLLLEEPAVPVVYAQGLIAGLGEGYFAEDRISAATAHEVVNLLYA